MAIAPTRDAQIRRHAITTPTPGAMIQVVPIRVVRLLLPAITILQQLAMMDRVPIPDAQISQHATMTPTLGAIQAAVLPIQALVAMNA